MEKQQEGGNPPPPFPLSNNNEKNTTKNKPRASNQNSTCQFFPWRVKLGLHLKYVLVVKRFDISSSCHSSCWSYPALPLWCSSLKQPLHLADPKPAPKHLKDGNDLSQLTKCFVFFPLFNILKTQTPFVHAGLLGCLHNPPNSESDTFCACWITWVFAQSTKLWHFLCMLGCLGVCIIHQTLSLAPCACWVTWDSWCLHNQPNSNKVTWTKSFRIPTCVCIQWCKMITYYICTLVQRAYNMWSFSKWFTTCICDHFACVSL